MSCEIVPLVLIVTLILMAQLASILLHILLGAFRPPVCCTSPPFPPFVSVVLLLPLSEVGHLVQWKLLQTLTGEGVRCLYCPVCLDPLLVALTACLEQCGFSLVHA